MRERIPRSGCKMLAHKRNKPTYIYGLAARAAAGSFNSPGHWLAILPRQAAPKTPLPLALGRRLRPSGAVTCVPRPRWPELQPHGLLAAVDRPPVRLPWTLRSSIVPGMPWRLRAGNFFVAMLTSFLYNIDQATIRLIRLLFWGTN